MAFKPKKTGGGGGDFEFVNVEPKAGNRLGRVSLIVDMGTQEREDFVNEQTGETKPQNACQQVAVFADLVNDVVDYGGKIGKAQYRMLLNKSFKGEVQGVNFVTVPPKDGDGKIVKGKPWTLHPANLLTKLAKAVGKPGIIVDNDKPESLDIERLLDEAVLIEVEVKKTPAKDKKDANGNPLVYTNVNFKNATPVPPQTNEDGDEVPAVVKKLTQPALCITFENAKKEDIKFIRPGLLKQIKLAVNYAGSQMQAAVEAFEAEKGEDSGDDQNDDQGGGEQEAAAPAPAPKPAAKKTAAAAKKAAAAIPASTGGNGDDDDVPFANPYRGKLSYLI